jgi:hypothetical protein
MESVRTGLRNIAGELLRTRPAEEAVELAWPLVCGKEVAARTRVAAFTQGTLIVEVTDPAWRAQLTAFARRYVAGYAELLGPVVQELKFVGKEQIAISS